MHVRRHIRSLLIAMTVLALTAGLVAGREMPSAAGDGLATAGAAAGKTVPVGPPAPEAPEAEEETTEPEPELTDPEDGEQPDNHGSVVSEAARGETPEGFRNHGEYVSSVARSGAGKPDNAGKPDAAGKPAHAGKPDSAESAKTSGKAKGRSAEAATTARGGSR